MTEGKLRELEPFFGNWRIESKIAEGKNSLIYKVFSAENSEIRYNALEIIKFPGSNEEISRAIESGHFATVDEYLGFAQKKVCENIEKMLSLRANNNIVRYEDYTVVKESSCFYVLILRELLTPLSDFIKDNRIKQKDTVKIGWDICNALEGFRQAGIIHRNIKTENIFVGEKSTYKLGDFGVDGLFRKRNNADSYKAPEAGTESEHSSDIYSLGIVLYRLLNNNRAPFLPQYPAPVSLEDREKAKARRLRGDLFPAPANADANLSHIVFTATAFRPEDRYTSPSQLKLALEDYVKGVLNSAPVAESDYHTQKITYVPYGAPKPHRKDGADSVTNIDKQMFAEAFKDDDGVEEEEKSYKKWYILIGVLAVILIVMVSVLVKNLTGDDNNAVNNTGSGQSYVEAGTTVPSTTQGSTEEQTTEEESTQQETTQETTEQETTEETTQEETTQEQTTEEETTQQETTEQETTQEETTTQSAVTPPSVSAGTVDENGKVYYDLADCQVIFTPQSEYDNEFVVEIVGVSGNDPKIENGAYVYIIYKGYEILRSELEITNIEKTGSDSYFCYMSAKDYDFFYTPDAYDYYVVLTAGSVETDTGLNTEKRIDF